jgi:hypothetical protein
MKVCDSEYAVPYLASVCGRFGLEECWAYRRSYSDHAWFGIERSRAEGILASADIVFNVSGATRLAQEQLAVRRWTYFGTDPVLHEIAYAKGDPTVCSTIDEHDETVTYGENIGTPFSPIPPLPGLKARTRQPVLLEHWASAPEPRPEFTTVTNWEQVGLDVEFQGEKYRWSKHHEFLKFLELPRKTLQPIEIAINLAKRLEIRPEGNEAVPAIGLAQSGSGALLESHGWRLADGPAFSTDPWRYRDYIMSSRAEFTVARDLNVRTRSGWFSERSACYLAAGRPVVTQDTGFGHTLPTGEGLFAFNTMEEILAAIEAINGDYARHSRAAHEIAQSYFAAERVLARLLDDLGC